VLDARAAFDALGRPKTSNDFTLETTGGSWGDMAAMWIMAVERQPDPALRDLGAGRRPRLRRG